MVQWSGGRQALLAAFMALIGAYRAYRGYIIIYRFWGLGVFRAGGWLADVARHESDDIYANGMLFLKCHLRLTQISHR